MNTAQKTFLGFIVYSITFVVILVAAAGFWTLQEYKKPGAMTAPITLDVPTGSASGTIAQSLLDKSAFDHERDIMVFKLALRAQNAASTLKAGEYEIPARASIQQIIALLKTGKVVQRQVTVPEGLTSYEIVLLLNKQEELQPRRLPALPEEGSLLPDTYSFEKNEAAEDVLERMEAAMKKTLDEAWAGRAKDLPIKTKVEAITLASIVEKETGVSEERARVAGVFINRLKRGMPLQTDPTVIYAITKGVPKTDGKGPLGRRLLLKDLETDSPYNTYKYPGLPPGPIANPGAAVIKATLNPETHDYIYFVADGTGGHVFSKTLAEHNANAAKWRKIRREQK